MNHEIVKCLFFSILNCNQNIGLWDLQIIAFCFSCRLLGASCRRTRILYAPREIECFSCETTSWHGFGKWKSSFGVHFWCFLRVRTAWEYVTLLSFCTCVSVSVYQMMQMWNYVYVCVCTCVCIWFILDIPAHKAYILKIDTLQL